MSNTTKLTFKKLNLTKVNLIKGAVVCFIDENENDEAFLNAILVKVGGSLTDIKKHPKYLNLKNGDFLEFPLVSNSGMDALIIVRKPKDTTKLNVRKVGAKLANLTHYDSITIFTSDVEFLTQITYGFQSKSYFFDKYKGVQSESVGNLNILSLCPKIFKKNYLEYSALIEGITLTRDLTNEPSNILTTEEFSKRLESLSKFGLKIKILEEAELKKLGMNALLGVGQGSPSPSKVVIMEWKGIQGKDPLVIVGKGVVFDTGGISLKPANGMEQMTVDMGGAGVVAGLMKTIALRGVKKHVIGAVGLVENMPDGNAQRPGDVVTSMKGDTIEIINTDAEGRLVLCDLLWYVQQRYNPKALIDLATLTGAIIVALGNEKAGVFSNNKVFAEQFIECALEEGEGAWQMPLDDSYDNLLKSHIADVKNVGGRPANSISAAKFLQRFVDNDVPWIHLDIAGVASAGARSSISPKGATGWGVKSLNKLIDKYF